ncbi:MAG: PorT family protein [Chitinophagaceae bacterium]|nr:MAG: PorT family protein [Chitinophagaceae bacterium]
MNMKYFLIGILFFLTVSQVQAQLHLGAKAGANMSKLDGVSYRDRYKLGYQFGAFVGYDIGKVAGIQTEVLSSQTNTSVEDGLGAIPGNLFSGRKRLNYVSVPLLLKLFPNSILSIHAGPQFSILTNRNKSALQNGKDLFRASDFSAVAGAELKLGALRLYGRYVWGFSDISDVGGKARSQQAQLGLALNLF